MQINGCTPTLYLYYHKVDDIHPLHSPVCDIVR